MNYPITRTKVILPRRRPNLLSRPRLLAMLDDLLAPCARCCGKG
ncbi:MAG: hypothetical protein ACK2TZ_11750 [Anaerolineales bacterium]